MSKFNIRLGTMYRYKILKRLGVFTPITSSHTILDVGGYDGYVLSKLPGKSRELVDIDARPIFTGIKYHKNDFLKKKFTPGYYDYIYAFDVLEHIPEGKEKLFLEKIERLLKKGGRAYITTPSRDIRLFPPFLTSWVSRRWGHYRCLGYTRASLENYLKEYRGTYEIMELNSRLYLSLYLLIRLAKVLLPDKLIASIIDIIARYDSKHNNGCNGYFLIRIVGK